MGKAFPDGVFLHTGQPQTGEGLFAPGLLIDQPENQFALSTGIRCADNALHIGAVHELFQDSELLFCAGRHKVLPPLRQDRQIGYIPFDVLFIVGAGRSQFYQMADTPTHDIAAALKVAILPPLHPQNLGVRHGNGRLFGHDQNCDKRSLQSISDYGM